MRKILIGMTMCGVLSGAPLALADDGDRAHRWRDLEARHWRLLREQRQERRREDRALMDLRRRKHRAFLADWRRRHDRFDHDFGMVHRPRTVLLTCPREVPPQSSPLLQSGLA